MSRRQPVAVCTHQDWVYGVALSPDGGLLATGCTRQAPPRVQPRVTCASRWTTTRRRARRAASPGTVAAVLVEHRPPRARDLELAEQRGHAPDEAVEDHETRRQVQLADHRPALTSDAGDRVGHEVAGERERVSQVRPVRHRSHTRRSRRGPDRDLAPGSARPPSPARAVADRRRGSRRGTVRGAPTRRCSSASPTEVEEADPAIGVEAVVARMGVAVERRGAGWMPVRNAR